MSAREDLFADADLRCAKLRAMAAQEEKRNAQWRIEAVLRYDAALIERLANDLHGALNEVERLREALERVYQLGRGPHVGIAREALNA